MNYLGLSKEKLYPVVDRLNDLLSSYHVYYQNLRCHHWYVEGENFFELHKQFEDLYNEAKTNIDAIAERVLTLRFQPVGRMSQYLDRSKISEAGRIDSDHDMVNHVLMDHQHLIQGMRDVISKASEAHDEGTIDLIAGMMKSIEKSSWMLDSWMSKIEEKKEVLS